MKRTMAYGCLTTAIAGLLALAASIPESRFEQRLEKRERHRYAKVGQAGDESAEAQIKADQFAQARTAPGIVLPGAYSAAFASLSGLPVAGGRWTEVTTRPYNLDDPRYRDSFASNSSGGWGLASGRLVGLAVDSGNIYIGGADGGVFRSTDDGKTWAPLTDGLPTLSIGDIRLAPDGALWLATGEANTGQTAYLGSGVYRLASPTKSVFSTSDRVGGVELESTFIGKLRFDNAGNVYAATSRGLFKHSASTKAGAWTRVLYPVPRPTTTSATTSRSRPQAPASASSPTVPGATARRTTASTIRLTAVKRSRV